MASGLFKYEGHRVVIEPEALILQPYKKVWDRDKSEDKTKAEMELAYMYFFCDPRSDFMIFTDEEARHKAIVTGEGLPKTWKVDKVLRAAMDYYLSFVPISSKLLQSQRKSMEKLIEAVESIDPMEEPDLVKRALLITAMSTVSEKTMKLIKEYDKTEKELFKLTTEASKETKGSLELTIFD